MKKQDEGFTLVELLIVIVILGILATVTVFAVRGITDQGQESACEADLKTLQTATEGFFAAYGGTEIPTGTDTGTAAYVAAVNDTTNQVSGPGASPEQTLINARLVVDTSDNYEVTDSGGITYQVATCIPDTAPAGTDVGDAVVN
ncbi:MAG: type II secretion system protein [Actinomycetota bacterium]